MGEKTEAEGGGNTKRRSARLKKEREAAEAYQRNLNKQPMKPSTMNKSERALRAEADIRASRMPSGYEAMSRAKSAMGARASAIEELTARRDDTRNPIARINLDNQIRELKAGGTPVQTTFDRRGARAGEILTVGVVGRSGRFSGRQGFDPGSGNVRLNPNTGAYESRYGMGGTSRSDSGERATKPATTTSTTVQDATNRTVSSGGDDPVRLAQLSTAAAGRKRRILLG